MDRTASPSTLTHIWLLAKYELTKRFTNKSGMISLIAFMLIWAILLLYPIKSASEFIMQPNFKDFTEALFGPGSLRHLFEWPVEEFAVFWLAALYLFPMFSIFIAADQFSSDKQRGSLRFLTLRVSRSSLFFGRFLGQMFIQLMLIILTLLATIALALSRDISLLLPSIVSIFIALINMNFPQLSWLNWMLPGSQIGNLINTQGLGSFVYAPIPLLQTAVILFAGKVLMSRSAL